MRVTDNVINNGCKKKYLLQTCLYRLKSGIRFFHRISQAARKHTRTVLILFYTEYPFNFIPYTIPTDLVISLSNFNDIFLRTGIPLFTTRLRSEISIVGRINVKYVKLLLCIYHLN